MKNPSPLAVPVIPLLGFAGTGLFSFGLACALLLVRPDTMSGDPVRGSVLALTHLITLGWIGSLLFGGAYLAGPLLAGSPLWSRRLPGLHLACHLAGLALLLGGLAVLRYDVAGAGAIVLVIGLVAMVVNLLITGSKRSLWNPANIAFQSALFWLVITGALALFMLRGRLAGPAPFRPEVLIALHAHFALFGFLAQALLAVSLRVIPELLGQKEPKRHLDALAWTGWAGVNGGLLILVPASLSGSTWVLFAVGAAVAAGVLCFALHLACSIWTHRERVDWSVITHATGIGLLVVLVAGALWRLPDVASGTMEETREWMRFYISLALLGPFSFAILGAGARLMPRLVWRLRFAPWTGHAELPSQDSLGRPAASAPAYFALLLAWVYFALGQWKNNPEAVRLGALLMLAGFGWFVFAIAPAIVRLVWGVTPGDLPRLKSVPEVAQRSRQKLL